MDDEGLRLRDAFPPGVSVPPLLRDFRAFLATLPEGSLGGFDLQPHRLDGYWIEGGEDLYAHFALFLHLADGTALGYWLREPDTVEGAPIVLLGSEGDAQVVADGLEGLLARVALGRFEPDTPLAGMLPQPDEDGAPGEDRRPELAAWLRRRLGVQDLEALVPVRGASPDLAAWLRARADAIVAREREDAHHQALTRVLEPYRPREPWAPANFTVHVVGPHFEAWHLHRGPQPFPEAALLEAPVRAIREAQAHRQPERGAWFRALVRLEASGHARVLADYAQRPELRAAQPTAADFRAELERFPRTEAWMPKWLREQVGH